MSFANCIILSQIWQNIYGDAYEKGAFEENSLYGIKLNTGYSDNIIDYSIVDKISGFVGVISAIRIETTA